MDLLDRYLQAVNKYLPWQRQDDILAELRANLQSQLDDKEAEAGRPLTPGEVEAWLKELGPPIRMAARYQPQQYLIGPALFPIYWYVLRLVFLWALIIYSVVSAIQIGLGHLNGLAIVEAVVETPYVLFLSAVWVTFIFAVIEFALTRCPGKCPPQLAGFYTNLSPANWMPSSLPPLEKKATRAKNTPSYPQAVADLIFSFLFLLYLLLIPQHPVLLLGPALVHLQTLPFQLAPIWMQFFWCVVVINLLQTGWRALKLWRGSWQRPHPVPRSAFRVIGLLPVIVLLTAHDPALVTLRHPALDRARYGSMLDTINRSIHLTAGLVCAILVVQLLWEVGQMGVSAYRKQARASR